jgi:pyrroline-5-carboxylate reductase
VTSPGGLTERGTKRLEDAGVREAFDSAVDAAVNP